MTCKHYFPLLLLSLFILSACNSPKGKDGKPLDTPTTGHIKILAEEGYKSIISSTIDVFDSIYAQASVEVEYTSQGQAIDSLIRDSIQVIVVSRKLTDAEVEDYFEPRGFTPYMTPFAIDAVAFIQHPDNKDTAFTVAQIREILSGKTNRWNQINPASRLKDIQIVFDNPLSGTVQYAKDSIAGVAQLPPNASALTTNDEVIDYVSKNKNALGIISAAVISDTDDKGVQSFLKEIRLCRIAKEEGRRSYGPYQAYIANGAYPFTRTVYVINAQARKGLGLGFASFIAGPIGQTIVLKDGLLPANAVTRLIEIQR